MKTIAAIAIGLVLSLAGAALAQDEPPAAPGQMGANPSGGMGDMMGMCMMMHPSIAVGTDAIYIVRGDQVLKLNKDTLKVIAIGTLPPAPSMGGMPGGAAAGRGPAPVIRPEMDQMMQQMQKMDPKEYEQAFLQNMIRHHEGAIDMSQLALVKATHPQLKDFAQKTIAGQGREQDQFANWLRNWYSITAVKQPTETDAEMTTDLRTLTDRDFEIRFMQDMITHHAEAVQMGRAAEQKALHPEVKAAAAKIVKQQSAEIAQLQKWLSSWYGVGAAGK